MFYEQTKAQTMYLFPLLCFVNISLIYNKLHKMKCMYLMFAVDEEAVGNISWTQCHIYHVLYAARQVSCWSMSKKKTDL